MDKTIKLKKSNKKNIGLAGKILASATVLGLATFGGYKLVDDYIPKSTQNKIKKQLNVNSKGAIDYFKDVIRRRPTELYTTNNGTTILEEKLGDGSIRKYIDYKSDGILDEVVINDKEYGQILVNSNYKGFDKLQKRYDFRRDVGDSRAKKKIDWSLFRK